MPGLGYEVQYSEYRNGNERFNTVRKVPNTSRSTTSSSSGGCRVRRPLRVAEGRARGATRPAERVTITLLDEARNAVATWTLRRAQPKKCTGPTLAAKGGGEVAMEELHPLHEGIEYS